MVELWGERWAIKAERRLWLAVAGYQFKCGVFNHIEDAGAKLDAYHVALKDVRPWEIREIELKTRHDLKARLEGFNLAAQRVYGQPLQLMHWGMTSADVVDNIALIRMSEGLRILGQERDAKSVRLRGIKGPVGTQQDMLELLGSIKRLEELDHSVAEAMNMEPALVMRAIGQVYPRSYDTEYAFAALYHVTSQPWRVIGNGYFNMVTSYSGDQWNEGDVSTSVIRRVALPGVFLAADAARVASKKGT